MKLVYHLTDEARRKIFLETGHTPSRDQEVEVDPASLRRQDRELLLKLNPDLQDRNTVNFVGLPRWDISDGIKQSPFGWLKLSAIVDDPVDLLAAYRDAVIVAQCEAEAARDAELDKLINELTNWPAEREVYRTIGKRFAGADRAAEAEAALAQAQARYREWRQVRDAEATAKLKAEVAERLEREAERREWALEHGSSRLRKCVEGGYDCQRLYAFERAAIEYPAYVLDFDDKARWKSRSGPSEAALDEARRVGGEVVWLTRFPAPDGLDQDLYDEDEACEAVVIRQYLGKYDLVKRI